MTKVVRVPNTGLPERYTGLMPCNMAFVLVGAVWVLGSYKLGWWEQPDALFTFLLADDQCNSHWQPSAVRLFATFEIMSLTNANTCRCSVPMS